MPYSFVVPEDAKWSHGGLKLEGLKLGRRVRNIRYREDFVRADPSRRALLEDLGFAWRRRAEAAAT